MISTIRYIIQQFRNDGKIKRKILQKFPTLSIEENVQFKGNINNLELGKDCIIQRNCVLHLGGMAWSKHKGKIKIGNRACISPNVVLYGTGPDGLTIGNDFDCGPGVCITSSKTAIDNVSQHDFGPVVIGDSVTLYANVVVSPGVRIGSHAVIGANSVVTNDIPDHALALGNPAKVVKHNIRK